MAKSGEIDKNSLWGELNIQKRQLCVKGILAQDLGFPQTTFFLIAPSIVMRIILFLVAVIY